MSSNWMFAGLNQLDPPAMGDDNLGLGGVGGNYSDNGLLSDYPSAALDAQLETWSNLTFDFTDQSPFDYAAANNYEEKVGGEGEEQDLDNRAGVVAGRNNDQVYGLLNSAEQARQFQELLLESSSSISSLHPSLAYPGRQLPLPPLSSLSSSTGNYSNGLPDFNELPSLQSAIASTSTLPMATTSRLPLLPPSTHSTPTTRSSPASSSTSTNKKVAKKAKVEKVVAAPVKVESEEDNELSIEGEEETSLEDKRKRNTAASARFRIKKKQREAALEDSAKALRDRVTSMEEELKTLKTENNWLRGLVMNPASNTAAAGIIPPRPTEN